MSMKPRGNAKLIITILVLAITLLVVGLVVTLQNQPEAADTSIDTPETVDETPQETPNESEEKPVEQEPDPTPTIDPELASSLDIEPMGITVFYVRGIPGFEFVIERTANGTEYVQFSSPKLVGTKCTDDDGVFASIIKNPSTTEAQSLSATTSVADDTYGLSLADATCTGNPALLSEYQEAFADAFSLLEAMPADS